MKEMHRRIAEIGLEATQRYGFVLAGGYAISANGMGDRPSVDVDLFTNQPDPQRFAEAVERLREALQAAGLTTEDNRMGPTFAELYVIDPATGQGSDIQLGLNSRGFPPVELSIGPVLDVRDAIAGKMSALWSRGETRDFIDIDTVLEDDRFTRADVLAITDDLEATPMDRSMLAHRFREAGRFPAEIYATYEIDAERRAAIIERFTGWADEIDPARW
jgi:hypothetical protein